MNGLLPCPICRSYDFFGDLVAEAQWVIREGVFTFELSQLVVVTCPYCFARVKICRRQEGYGLVLEVEDLKT